MRLQLPHPLVLLLGGVAVAALLTWLLPAGAYERRLDEATGREVVVAGTYHAVEPAPIGPMAAVLGVAKGIVAGADVLLTVLFVGGAFALLDATGALGRLVGALVGRARRPRAIVVLMCVIFATFGALENMQEEIIALAPVLLVLSRGLGFGAITALAMSVGAAAVGSAFGPTNPFQAGIALKFAGLPPLSQPGLRLSLLVVAVVVWIAYTLAMTSRDDVRPDVTAPATEPATRRDLVLLAMTVLPFGPYVFGVVRYNWGFNELSAIFLVAAFAVGLVSGRNLSQTAIDFLEASKGMLPAALFVGIARGISVVLTEGRVMDTIIYGLASPLAHVPGISAAILMVPAHALLHVAVPSVSGQAALTMPIMAPLADLLGISRDAAVIAYQTGAGLMDIVTPTSGALLAVLLGAQVSFGRWLKFVVPGVLLVAIVGIVGLALAA